jgi:hypothetical protein
MINHLPYPNSEKRRGHAVLVGYGKDENGGHIRITFGDDFRLEGGSEETHRKMQKRAVELREELARRGIDISSVGRDNFDMAAEIVRSLAG